MVEPLIIIATTCGMKAEPACRLPGGLLVIEI